MVCIFPPVKYSGGLDGLRGVAVLVVVLFHAQVPLAGGGFLGVSLFFTLSGFLITSLLLAEFDSTGTVALREFYVRRARRLLPAAYVCLLSVALLGGVWGAAQRRDLPADLVASVANVANWRFGLSSDSYADLFAAAPSPVAHFWSLAIEEQIYLLLPLVVIVALRRGRRALGWVTLLLLIASVGATLLTVDRDLVYNGTHTRAAELLVGVALALYLARGRHELGEVPWRRARWLPGAVAGALLLGLFVVASLEQGWIYRGGLPAVAVLSAVLIAAVVSEQFPNRLLDVAPLVVLGRLSYGIYLFHWPVFLIVDAERTGLGPVAVFVVRCVVIGVVTVASARLLEQPVRLGRVPRGTRRFVTATACGALAVVLFAVVVVPAPAYTRTEQLLMLGDAGMIDFRASTDPVNLPAGERSTQRPFPNESSPGGEISTSPEPFRVAVIGTESSAIAATSSADVELGGELDDDLVIGVIDDVRPECPLSTTELAECATPVDRLRTLLAGSDLDAVVVSVGPVEDAEIGPRSLAATTVSDVAAFAATQIEASTAVQALLDEAALAGIDVVLFSTGQRHEAFDVQVVQLAIASPSVPPVIRTGSELASVIHNSASTDRSAARSRSGNGASRQRRVRVLVIGDSTSLNLATALNDGSDGRLEVVWAGANGCPISDVEATRLSSAEPWSDRECESYEDKLAPLVTSFAPDVVLVVSGPTELAEQRFAGDPDGHVAGDPGFTAARDRAIDAIAATVGEQVPVLVTDAPAIRPGGFASSEMAEPARLAAVNEQVELWDRRSPQIARFPYRAALEGAESSPGALRSDGVHPDAAPLEALARSTYVDQVIELTARVRAEIEASPTLGG